jgi:glycosyltransferase involved in cell wall biosynthesis
MSILYLLTSAKPVIEGTDAAFQDVAVLNAAFNGETVNLCPRNSPGRPFPPQLFGFHRLPALWRAEQRCAVAHLFHSVPYFFPVLHCLRVPIVYTVLASLKGQRKPSRLTSLSRLQRIVVSSERDAEVLQSWGLSNGAIVPPAVAAARLAQSSLPLQHQVTLLMASAPWVEHQFEEKGVDTLLDAAARLPHLKLVLLWRGLLQEELQARIARRGIGDRVEIVNRHVDINDYLKRVHATVLLAKRSDIVKAYPHSLLESLVAGKPVILSNALPMADYVRRHGCGLVLEAVDVDAVVSAIDRLQSQYETLADRARSIDAQDFSEATMIANYRKIYDSATQSSQA